MNKKTWQLLSVTMVVTLFGLSGVLRADLLSAKDPGPRGGAGFAGGALDGLTAEQTEMFNTGLDEFSEEETVKEGLGPRFNFVSCAGCHAQPAVGGTSPDVNPLFRVVSDLGFGTNNVVPSFITPNGPIREARFQFNPNGSRDGGVHALFVISGHSDAGTCGIKQEDFQTQVNNRNIVFRIPTPVFGAGLIEQIQDSTIVANLGANSFAKAGLGISGRPNRSGNDGTITRFGWKAQNKSLLIFSGEAYNVEMGITSEGFQQERDETPNCQIATVPNTVTPSVAEISAIESFAAFQRFLAPAKSSTNSPGGFSRSREAASSSPTWAVRSATRRLRRPTRTARSRRSPARARISSPTWRCTPWVPGSPTTSCRAARAATSSGPRRSGVWGSGSSSCTMGGPMTSSRRSRPTAAAATPSSARRRPTP